MDFIKYSCEDFVSVLSSKAPVPGGGGAAAMVGAIGAALCSMVGNLTVGRKKYAHVEDDVLAMLKKGQAVQERLLALVDEDARGFEPLAKAYAIPKDDPMRGEIMEAACTRACDAPLAMMQCCGEALDLLSEMLEKGSATLVSDVGCGALCCKAALVSASMNVYINTASLKNKETAAGLEERADALLRKYSPLADEMADQVMGRIRKEV